ncbi:transglutaminase-like domain-containing protein [Paenibacillus puerhi]|uniref:transglutaminase-like domain-containing protein n=1 Tax=Paenibacillus puerhi TaxID=2692622 RepID=UPI001356F077|nr:transglutaminase-like domain-containing protein [Paenibacillus puerhi]
MSNILTLLTLSGFLLLGTPVPAPMSLASVSHQVGQAFSDDGAVVVRVPEHAAPAARKRVLIQSGAGQQFYPLPASFQSGEFPLKDGDGTYTVTLYENARGNEYKKLSSQVIKLQLKNPNAVYLQSIQPIHWTEQMDAIRKARELAEQASTPSEKIELIYAYIAERFAYDYDKARSSLTPEYTPDIEATFAENAGICYDASALFAAMLRSVDVPAKLVKGYAPDVQGLHAWNEVYMEGKGWATMDITTDAPYVQAGREVMKWKDASLYRPSLSF